MKEMELIVTIVNRGHSDAVMDAARSEGATGGTILHARGTGIHEAERFFGVTIQPEKELVLILAPKEKKQEMMRAIYQKAGFAAEGRGLSFSLPVDDVVGIVHLEKEE